MSIEDVLKSYKPRENDAKPTASGDFVAQVEKLLKRTGQDGRNWLILEASIINVVKAKEDNQAVPGDEVSKIYNEDDDKQVEKFLNDMFTAGIDIDRSSKEAMYASFENAVNKLVYLRGWQYDKKDGSGKANSVAIKSKNLLTPENSTSQLPF